MEEHVTLFAAFGAGVLSFISPCVLPLVPGYLSYISGVSLDEMRGQGGVAAAGATGGGAVAVAAGTPAHVRRRILLSSLAFILGFSLVFVAIGAAASAIGAFLLANLSFFSRVAGAVIIVFGLHTMGVLRIEWLYQEKRVHTNRKPAGMFGALLVGVAFAFGWTPCIGPILSAILAYAATQETVDQGVRLLAVYSAGLGLPFFGAALAMDRFFIAMSRIRRHYRAIEIVSGLLLVGIGLLIFTNQFTLLAQWLTPYLPVY